jgi:hypothetical protein
VLVSADGTFGSEILLMIVGWRVYAFALKRWQWVQQATLSGTGSQERNAHSSALSADGDVLAWAVTMMGWGSWVHWPVVLCGYTLLSRQWTQRGDKLAAREMTDFYFGSSVSMSADGQFPAAGHWNRQAELHTYLQVLRWPVDSTGHFR